MQSRRSNAVHQVCASVGVAVGPADSHPMSLTVLFLDDEELLVGTCEKLLTGQGFRVLTATRAREALVLLERHRPDLVFSDVQLPDGSGLDVLAAAKKADPDCVVVMITAFATVESSIEAIRAGAYDYLPKPFTATQLQVLAGRAANQVQLARENAVLREQLRARPTLSNTIGASKAMRAVADLVARVAPTDASVFVTGESGTGKELVARGVHELSQRRAGPFLAVNCAALPGNLLESELFGHERGAFTGAEVARPGLLEGATSGSFFLDEVAEMSMELQAKLLRAIQEKRARRVGGNRELSLDVRWIAATNRDPEEAVEQGTLRQDLFFRLNVIPIHLPPLRSRREDIPLLAHHFLRRFATMYQKDGSEELRLSADALAALVNHDWPGNVRELQNVIERVVALSMPGQEIRVADLPASISGAPIRTDGLVESELPYHDAKERSLQRFERRYLEQLLERHEGNISRAAEAAGMARRTIHRLLVKHRLADEEE